jgi:multiple antibiotic resistance protein
MDGAFISNFAGSLFALLNSVGILPLFLSYTAGETRAVQKWLAAFVSLTVFGLLLLFLFTGLSLLKFFGITLAEFRIAGGIVLMLIGIQIVTGNGTPVVAQAANDQTLVGEKEALSVYRRIVIPLAMPLLVGPGVIASVILCASEADRMHVPVYQLVLVMAAVSLLNLIIFWFGNVLKRMVGDVGLSIATRTLGLIVTSIGVRFVLVGLSEVTVNLIRSPI